MKQKMIEEKLEKLGVEKGSGSSVPNIHAPHARAASVRYESYRACSSLKHRRLDFFSSGSRFTVL